MKVRLSGIPGSVGGKHEAMPCQVLDVTEATRESGKLQPCDV